MNLGSPFSQSENDRRIQSSDMSRSAPTQKLLAKAEVLLQLSLSHIDDEALANQVSMLIEQINKAG